jgi:ornithine carbamoyltransferase
VLSLASLNSVVIRSSCQIKTFNWGTNDLQSAGEPIEVTSRVVSSMTSLIFARLGAHSEIEALAASNDMLMQIQVFQSSMR